MKANWKTIVVLLALLSATMLSPASVTIELLALTLWALIGPAQTIQAMSLSVVLKYLNPALVTYGGESGPLFWLVLLAAILRILPTMNSNDVRVLWPIWLFSFVATILSAIASAAPVVSFLKLATFVGVISTVVVAFRQLDDEQVQATKHWLLTLSIIVIGLSALTLIQPAIAFKLVPNSIQGIFNHPQTLGTFIVPFAAYWASGVLLARDSKRSIDFLLMIGVWAIMFMTLARTAAIAALAGVAAAVLIRALRGRAADDQLGLGRVVSITVLFIGVAVVLALTTDIVANAIHAFIHKREAQDVGTAFYQSRGMGIESEWNNFLMQPLTGWGFGVYADGHFPDGVVEIAGIPISVPVEKGFIPTAVLEETGIFGGVLFFFAMWHIGRLSFRAQDLRWIAVFVACLLVNVGEAVILSPGGIGLMLWLCIALGLRLSRVTSTATLEREVTTAEPRFPNLMRTSS